MRKYLVVSIFFSIIFSANSETYYISPNTGNDQNSGQLSSPFKTINQAVQLLKSGDEIVLMAGDYHEDFTIYKKDNITISAYGDGKAILYGTYKEFISNDTYPWKLLRREKNGFLKNRQYVYVAPLPKIERRSKLPKYYDQFNYIFDKNGKQLFGYRKREDFNKRSRKHAQGVGYWFSKDSVYVAVNDPYDDRYSKLYITRTGIVCRNLGSKNLIIDGGENNDIVFKYSSRYAYSAEGNVGGSMVKNVNFENCNSGVHLHGIRGKVFSVIYCKFIYKLEDKWIWTDVKSTMLGSSGITYAKGEIERFEVKNNHLEGVFNGVVALQGNTIISNNFFLDIGDDAVELDGPAENIIVKENIFIDCFTAFSLCPTEKGPVYIFDNIIYSMKDDFPFQIQKDGSIRLVRPKALKFYNLKDGNVLKDGKKQRVSGNVHFYYNTVILKNHPLAIGAYNKKFMSPVNSNFYNNIFYSEGTMTKSTGFSKDGIDIDNNLFYSSFKNREESRLFIGWDGANHNKKLKNTSNWTNNIYTKIEFKDFEKPLKMPQKSPIELCSKSEKKLLEIFRVKTLPDYFPGAKTLNNRLLPGAK